MPPTKRPLALSSSSRANIRDDDEDDERPAMTKVQAASPAGLTVKKRIVDDKENRTRPAGKKSVGERKTSSSLTGMYDDDDDDELSILLPTKAVRKPSKPKGSTPPFFNPSLIPAEAAAKQKKTAKARAATPEETTEESSIDSIIHADDPEPSLTSITEESISIEEPQPLKKPRGGRPRKNSVAKSDAETPQTAPKPRARSTSAQPPARTTAIPQEVVGVKGRKPKAAVISETQVNMSVVQEEEEVEEVQVASKARYGSILPHSLTNKSSFERTSKKDRLKELQTQSEKNFALYKERAEKRFKAADELVASLTAQLETQKNTVNPSQLKDLESKVKTLEDKLQQTQSELATETAANAILNARLFAQSQTSTAQLKEELHSDLSGLIFRNVEREGGNTIFDCLQTGRNGTLHYKLTMEDRDVNDPHGQVAYTPLLDPSRDAKIMTVLPDYLTDEIMFAREQASMFYCRLNQYLQKKID